MGWRPFIIPDGAHLVTFPPRGAPPWKTPQPFLPREAARWDRPFSTFGLRRLLVGLRLACCHPSQLLKFDERLAPFPLARQSDLGGNRGASAYSVMKHLIPLLA